MSIKLRSKPTKPVRKKKELHSVTIYDGTSLMSLVKQLPDHISSEDAILEADWDYEAREMNMNWYEEESVKAYTLRVKKYDAADKRYKEWYKMNEAAILKEKQCRENAEKAKAMAKLEKERKRLEKRMAALEKRLKSKL